MNRIVFTLLALTMFNCLKAQTPTITSFSPINAKPSDAVTITGTNFNTTTTNNIVFFGATKATVSAATVNSLTVTVPVGATYAPITVLNTATSLAAYSLQNFTPTFTPAKTNINISDFSAPIEFASSAAPKFMALGDLDGDGKPDLVVAHQNSQIMSVYRNTSTSGIIDNNSFANRLDFVIGFDNGKVVISDLDGDGKPEIILANPTNGLVYVYRNLSTSGSITSGSFATKVSFEAGRPNSMAIADVDGDGKPDIITASSTSFGVSILRNTSNSGIINSGSFAPRVNFVSGVSGSGISLDIADIDGDSKLDIVTSNSFYSTISVLRNTSSIGSINSSSFAANVDFSTGIGPRTVALGDIDGDGKPDLVTGNFNSSSISVFRNQATSGITNNSSFATRVDFSCGSSSMAIGDVNGDGKLDIVSTNKDLNHISVLRNQAISGTINSSSFAARVDIPTGQGPQGIVIGDVDGDSKPDLITSNDFVLSSLSVLRNTDIVVPITITSFKAFTKNSGIQVEWNTQNETNFDRYEVEKSTNGFNFNKAGTIVAKGLANYDWFDISPSKGDNYYRLKMIDKDNSYKYSSIVNVKIGSIKNIFTVVGNPIKNKIVELQMRNVEKGNYTISVYNNIGQQIMSKIIVHGGGSATQTLYLSKVYKGTYQLSITGSNIRITKILLVE